MYLKVTGQRAWLEKWRERKSEDGKQEIKWEKRN